jgi:hypothetical protein
MENYNMYEIDTSGFFAYINTIFRLVGGGLRLDPLAFQSAFNGGASPSGIFIWIVLIAGLSLLLGQSVVLFANRVKPTRFVISLFVGAIKFILDVLVFVIVVWSIANLLGAQPWDFWQVGRAIALVAAPYWLGVFIMIPYLGLIWERLIKVYVFLALLVAVQTIFGLPFFQALASSVLVWLVSHFLTLGFGRIFTPITDRITQLIVGTLEFSSTRQIYEMFARHDQIEN